jgi:hypothetical protein
MAFSLWCQHNITSSPPTAAFLQATNAMSASSPPLAAFSASYASMGIFTLSSTLTSSQSCSLFGGALGVNITTNAAPSGLLWGALKSVSAAGAPTHFATLDDVQAGINTGAITSNTGVAFLTVTSTTVSVSMFHNQPILPTVGQHIHGPALPMVSAGVLYSICGLPPATRNCTAADDYDINYPFALINNNATWINAGLTYLNVHTATYPAGSIRGQVVQAMAATSPTCTAGAAMLQANGAMVAALMAVLAMCFQ